MFKKRFHEKWAILFLVLLFSAFKASSQCPTTKSATFPMLEPGIPSLDKLELVDFLVNPADSANYKEVVLSQDLFLCIDVGIREINISGLDTLGNAFSCNEFLWVYDSVFLCSNNIRSPKIIGGKITTDKNQPIENVTVALAGNNINYFRGTNKDGLFVFENFDTTDYRIIPNKTDGARNGISTFDILLLQKHILRLKFLDSPYKIIAADLNSSGSITSYDMVLLRKIILSIIDEFPNTPSWRFVDANYVFSDKQNPFLDDFPESFLLKKEISSPQLDNRFIAIKVGDLNNSVILNIDSNDRANRTETASIFTVDNQNTKQGELVFFGFSPTVETQMEGMQFTLQYDENKLEFIGVESKLLITENNYSNKNGKINFSWTNPEGVLIEAGTAPFKFQFKALHNVRLSEAIKLDNRLLNAEIYVSDRVVLPLAFDWDNSLEDTGFKVFNNYPNPFSTSTTIPFYLPQTGIVQLTVFNTKGQLIISQKQFFNLGENAIHITEILPSTGIYFYQLESDFGITIGKMNYLLK